MRISSSTHARIRVSESTIVSWLVRFLESSGYRVAEEVPSMGASADVVGLKGRWVTAFEAKVSSWGRAIEQASAHEMVADYMVIAIGTVEISPALLAAVKERGYGLIHCDPEARECRWVQRPRYSRVSWAPERRRFVAAMRAVSNAS